MPRRSIAEGSSHAQNIRYRLDARETRTTGNSHSPTTQRGKSGDCWLPDTVPGIKLQPPTFCLSIVIGSDGLHPNIPSREYDVFLRLYSIVWA